MKEDFRFALMLAVVISPCVIVGNVLSQFFAGSMNQPAPTCLGECCPCDVVDAHVVAKWLDEHRDDVITNTGQGIQRSYSNRYETKGGLLVIFLSDDRGDAGQAPVGDAEGDE